MHLATVSIVGWRDDGTTWSAWAGHARSEFSRRLRRSVSLSPAERRDLERRVKSCELVVFRGVAIARVESLCHILEALGATVTIDSSSDAS